MNSQIQNLGKILRKVLRQNFNKSRVANHQKCSVEILNQLIENVKNIFALKTKENNEILYQKCSHLETQNIELRRKFNGLNTENSFIKNESQRYHENFQEMNNILVQKFETLNQKYHTLEDEYNLQAQIMSKAENEKIQDQSKKFQDNVTKVNSDLVSKYKDLHSAYMGIAGENKLLKDKLKFLEQRCTILKTESNIYCFVLSR